MPEEQMLALLDKLLIGAANSIDTVEGWIAWIAGPDQEAAWFSEQLLQEWFPAPPPDRFCADAADQVRARLAAWHPGWPHLWAHILRVTGTALALAAEANTDPVLVFLMVMCHDVGKLDEFHSGERHAEVGARFAADLLQDYLAADEIAAIQAAIRKRGDDPLTHLLHDADKLDKIGAGGLLRRISTHSHRSWLPLALRRVSDDAGLFPRMSFDLSRDLAASKRDFQAWFLPLAFAALEV